MSTMVTRMKNIKQEINLFHPLKRRNSRGQMKIQQMAFMLLAVFIFFVLIGMMILSFKMSGLKETAAGLNEKNARLLVSKLSNSPEFSCGEAFGTTKINCIDMDKVILLQQNIVKYRGFWNIDNVEIRKIYPASGTDILCSMENYPDCNVLKLVSEDSSGISVGNFVSLCRIEEGNPICELGKLMVTYDA